ncbi:MAG TPA: hypothetical protein VL856_00020 [Acidimicrobiia bacterium]|nr:hypothetical protein [Acidimicrobiia bacterium]
MTPESGAVDTTSASRVPATVDRRRLMVGGAGTRSLAPLDENHGARAVLLTVSDLREMQAAFAPLTVHGESMDAANMAVLER